MQTVYHAMIAAVAGCVTEQILRLLSPGELNAVIGHEIAHLKDRDAVITTLIVMELVSTHPNIVKMIDK